MPTDYEDKKQQRIDRFRERAKKLRELAEKTRNRGRTVGEGIPLGQPILVGHHSQRRAERDSERIQRAYERAEQLEKEATALEIQATAAANNQAISSDDPEALEKLKEKLTELLDLQNKYKAVNRAIRMKDTTAGNKALQDLGFNDNAIARLRTPDFTGQLGVPDYTLRNNNAKIKATKQRIAELEAKLSQEGCEEVHDFGEVIGKVTFIINPELNRVQLVFEKTQDTSIKNFLRVNGFVYSFTHSAWQRKWNSNAVRAARDVLENLAYKPCEAK
jgi:DNA repair exonuclease SbcCD ATPase subunit